MLKKIKIGTLALSIISSSIYAETVDNNIPFEDLNKFSKIYHILKTKYVEDISGSTLIDYAIKGMIDELDPHSKYMHEEEDRSLMDSIEGSYAGIGIEIEETEGGLKIVTPFDNSPATKAGLKTNDIIIKVNDIYLSTLKNLTEAVSLLRGKEGTKVTITIKRDNNIIEKEVIREKIKLESVIYKILENKYGYIRVSSFQGNTTESLKDSIKEIKKNKEIKGYILDLRNNPGGLLSSAIEIVDLFIDKKSVAVSVKGRNNEEQLYYTKENDIINKKPLIILVNEGSASASEIVAGALQDLNRAIVIGRNTFGKGSVQEIINFGDNTSMKYTTARYYTPNGRSIQAEGIIPDIFIEQVKIEKYDLNTIKEKDLEGHIDNTDKKEKEKNSNQYSVLEDYYIKNAIDALKVINLSKR